METEKRRAEYDDLFRNVDETEKRLVDRLIDECIYYEEQMESLRQLPFISVNPRNAAQQKMTPAAKLYKEYATSYMNALRILLNILRKVENAEADDLLRRLEEFTA